MDLVSFSIKKPVTVISIIVMVVLFGLISLNRLPIQLAPTVVEPVISVTTTWRGATPYEIEREIIEEQENTLKGLTNLVKMESSSSNGQGQITLTFKIGTEVNDALLRVSNKLNEVPSYPADVDQPAVNASGAQSSFAIWVILKAMDDNPRHVYTYRTFFENEIRQYLERVKGVSELFLPAGTAEEMHVVVSPEKLASHRLTVDRVINALRNENVNISAGILGVGRRDYRIRTTAEFKSPEQIAGVVLASTGQERVTIGDVAKVERGYAKSLGSVLHNGTPGMAIGLRPETGTNILELTESYEKAVEWLNETKLKPQGLYLEWVYDQRFYINSAINMIKQNILFGGCLAIVVLLIFLRSLRATIVVGMAIPISVIGTFIMLYALGRNLNVVSMAGIAFAVGMLVDNAIVVIENIDRHRKMGKTAYRAALEGTKEVWGAVLASTITTLAVFLPVVFIEEEAGQLFRDIAIAVVAAVSLSLFVSVSVIPMLAQKLLAAKDEETDGVISNGLQSFSERFQPKVQPINEMLSGFGLRLRDGMMWLVGIATLSTRNRIATVVLLITLAICSGYFLMPQKDYLPQGNRNFILSFLIPPPGLSLEERNDIGNQFFELAKPHIKQEVDGVPAIRNMFYVGREGFMIVGALAEEWDKARDLLPLFNRMSNSIPGIFGVASQPGVFQRNVGGAKSVEVNISGDDLTRITTASAMLFGAIRNAPQGMSPRPIPSVELTYPEVHFIPDRDLMTANGMTSRQFGVALDVLMDGTIIGDFKEDGKKKIDLVVKSADDSVVTPEDVNNALLATPTGRVVPVSSLARMKESIGVSQIRHLERERTVTLQVSTPVDMPLQVATDIIENQLIPAVGANGAFDGLNVSIGGTADKLKETAEVLGWNFIMAAVIAYLLMASLFGNFIYPLIIMLTVPLAGAGGVLGVQVLNIFLRLGGAPIQQMDILTMLGFVILIGVVVNNAILIVHQSLNNFHLHNMDYEEAVLESVRSRLRPIYMSATTSIFGMLPLVVIPGAGAEMYRGLGSVLLGGLAVSTIFTVFVIPAILMWVIKMEKREVEEG
ncbi:MAG: AcrB/AcrD/AcrF family protein [Desulfuromonas sp.]|nr:MAG: AcrB/AcrD/AcrF family protein [Desulfuromonas sp.]